MHNRRKFLKLSASSYTLALFPSLFGCGGSSSNQTVTTNSLPSTPSSQTWQSTHPYLVGNHYPIFDEISLSNIAVIGAIPSDLHGAYFRNGPNQKYEPIQFTHPFDGDGMIHGLYFQDGQVHYKNRWVQTQGLIDENKQNHAIYKTFEKNTSNTHVIPFNGQLLSLYEGGLPYLLDNQLNTLGIFDFDQHLEHKMIAHPKIDPDTNELIFARYYMQTEPLLTYFRVSADGELLTKVAIDIPHPNMVHDIAITKNYAVFVITPVSWDKSRQEMVWLSNTNCELIVVDKHTGEKLYNIPMPTFFFWHFQNCYEDNIGENIVFDIVQYSGPTFSMRNAPGASISSLSRYKANLNTLQIHTTNMSKDSMEFPIIPPALVGKKYRYAYAPVRDYNDRPYVAYYAKLAQFDMENETTILRDFGNQRYVGEVTFAPKKDAIDPEDGYIIVAVFDANSNKTDVLILNSLDFLGPPIATVKLPTRIPNGFHGSWAEGVTFDPI
ncbi:carotenoid oxygenase family protein [Colwelliaceae bacterium 6441]